ncbi:MAG: hypothetical protein IT319_16725 [Anaerolineae bacterium]|nr:hypothetical protein [Anaerolineae bacterium]
MENFEIDLDDELFSVFTEIFDFRNSVVHAKPESYDYDKIAFNKRGRPILPEWKIFEKCNVQNAAHFYDKTETMLNTLQKELKVETVSLISPERATWWRAITDSEK